MVADSRLDCSIQRGGPSSSNLFADLYFSKNPLHWVDRAITKRGRTSITSLTCSERFDRVVLNMNEGHIQAGAGINIEHQFPPNRARELFLRVLDQRRRWLRSTPKGDDLRSFRHDSSEHEIQSLIQQRCPTDWKLTTESFGRGKTKSKIETLTGYDGGISTVLRKIETPGEDIRYEGALRDSHRAELKEADAKYFFDQIIEHGSQFVQSELRYLVKNDLLSIIDQIPKDKWITSKFWNRPQTGAKNTGYFARASGKVYEGRNVVDFTIEATVDTLRSEQRLSVGITRNGHTASLNVNKDDQAMFLDAICDTCDLKRFHRTNTSRIQARRVSPEEKPVRRHAVLSA